MALCTALKNLRFCTLLVLLSFPVVTHAQPAAEATERAAAQVLFDAGRDAMAKKDYDEACAKFEESHRLDPAAGTLLNLGNCEEKRGRPASAWDRYKGAIEQLREDDRRRIFAEKKIQELMPNVPHLTVHLAEDAPEGAQVWRNETPISGSLGIPLPLNPGEYELVVEAPGFEAQVFKVELGLGEQKTITVRPGDELPPETDAPASEPPTTLVVPQSGFTQSTWGYVVGGVGAAAAATSIGLTLAALGPARDYDKFCDRKKAGFDEAKCAAARSEGLALTQPATVLGIISGVALGVGAYLIFTDDSDEPEATAVEAGSFGDFTGLRVRGTF